VGRDELEELVVERHEAALLGQETEDRDRAEQAAVEVERNARRHRLFLETQPGVVVAARQIDLTRPRAAPDHAPAERNGPERRRLDAERSDQGESPGLVGLEDGDLLGADQVADDVLDDRERLAAVERGVKPVARDVEAREIGVLLLDFDVLLGESPVLFLDGREVLLQPLPLGAVRLGVLLQAGDLFVQEAVFALERSRQDPELAVFLEERLDVPARTFST